MFGPRHTPSTALKYFLEKWLGSRKTVRDFRTYAPAAQQPPRLLLLYQLLLADRLLRFGLEQSVERALLLAQKSNRVGELQTLVWRMKRLLVASIQVKFG